MCLCSSEHSGLESGGRTQVDMGPVSVHLSVWFMVGEKQGPCFAQ